MIRTTIINIIRGLIISAIGIAAAVAIQLLIRFLSISKFTEAVFGLNLITNMWVHIIIGVAIGAAGTPFFMMAAKKYCWDWVYGRVTVSTLDVDWNNRIKNNRPIKGSVFNLIFLANIALAVLAVVFIFVFKDKIKANLVALYNSENIADISYFTFAGLCVIALSQPIYAGFMMRHYKGAVCPECGAIFGVRDIETIDEYKMEGEEQKVTSSRERIGSTSVDGQSVDVYANVANVKTRKVKRNVTVYKCECQYCKALLTRDDYYDLYDSWKG